MTALVISKEGWLHKRGEHIKTWRPRYFILNKNGNFLGYNNKPCTKNEMDSPNNIFYVKDCKILISDKPKLNMFILRCFSSEKNTIERVFAASSNQEREEWIRSIQNVSNFLNGNFIIEKSSHEKQKITLHDFEFLKILGIGTYCKVILCRERFSKRLCAMKILKKNLIISKNEVVHAETESRVLRTLKHPFITGLIYSFQTTDRLCLVMEYVNGGELFFHLRRERKFTEDKARFYLGQICLAIGFLHENNVVYRDLKLENILLDCEGNLKLADFGLCKSEMSCDSRTKTFCGTLEYLAPEIVCFKNLKENGYTRAVDYWALGVLLYEMLVGRLPFSSKSDQHELYHSILNDQIYFPCDLSQESTLILSQLLNKDPYTRLGSSSGGFEEIKRHPFFRNIDWKKLYNKEVKPPFRPSVSSETDTCNFEAEFTGENVQLTPPDSNERLDLANEMNYFDSFSFYGSKTSLASQQSSLSMKSVEKIALNSDKFDVHSLANDSLIQISSKKSNSTSSEYLPSPQTPHSSIIDTKSSRCSSQCEEDEMSSAYLASNAFPNIIHFTDNTGQFYHSKAYFTDFNQIEISNDSNSEDKNESHQQNCLNKKQEFLNINLNYKYL